MEQRGNLILFILLCMIILIGWPFLQRAIWPPAEKDPKDIAKKEEPKKKEQPKEVKKEEPKPKAVSTVSTGAVDLWYGLGPDKQQAAVAAAEVAAQALPGAMPVLLREVGQLARSGRWASDEKIQLGGKEFFIDAVLTTRGAGLRELTLTQFRAADTYGRPTDEKLKLLHDDPHVPNYLLYHYPYPDKKDAPPVLTLGQAHWQVQEKSPQRVVFFTQVPDSSLKIIKTYELQKTDYHIGLTVEIRDERERQDGAKNSVFRYQLAGAKGLPIEGGWYSSTQRSAVIGMANHRGSLFRELEDAARISHRHGGDRVPEGDPGDTFLQYAGVITQYFAALVVVDNLHDKDGGAPMDKVLQWARPTLETTEKPGKIEAISGDEIKLQSTIKGEGLYSFQMLPRAVAQVKAQELKAGDEVVISFYQTGARRIATWIRRGQALHPFADDIMVRVNSRLVELAPQASVKHKFMLYHGPVKTRLLSHFGGDMAVPAELVERYTETLHLNTLTDYRSAGPFGWFSEKIRLTDLIVFFTKLIHGLLYYLHLLVPDYGINIIMVTVIVRGLMFPISRKQAYLSIKMQEVAPELKKLQEKYKNDPRAKTEAMMDLYRKHGVNPLGGCLPLLMQLPVFLGLYFALQESINFRLARFLWMPNLAAPDMFVWWGEGIPFVSDPDNQGAATTFCIIPLSIFYLGPYLNLLPIFAVVLMLMQQKLMTPPPQDEQQAMQQKMFKYMMVFFGIMFYKVASGLCLYFIASSLWGLAERKLLPKKPTGAVEPAAGTSSGSKGFRTKPKAPEKKEADGAFQKVKNWWSEILKQAKKK